MTGLSQPAATGDVREQEFQSRLASISVGTWLSAIVCLGAAIYALHTWTEPNRDLILAAIRPRPVERAAGPAAPARADRPQPATRELFFVAWSIADIVLIATIAGLDGGSHSAYMLLLVLPFLFAALSYPPRTIAAVGTADLIAFFVVAFAVGGGLPLSGFGLFAVVCIGAARRLGGAQSGAPARRN